jgi:transposase-like protein
MAERTVIRELVTLLGFEIDEKDLDAFDKRIDTIRKNLRRMAIAVGIVAGALTAMIVKTVRAGDNIAKTSRRLGLGVEALQEWRFAADRAGVSAQTFDMAVQRFGRRAAEAAQGTGEAVKALAEMGIQLRDQNGNLRSLDTLLEAALIGLAGQRNELDRNRLAMKLFDSEGVRMVQMLEGGAEQTLRLKRRAQDLGGVMSAELIANAEKTQDAWTDLGAALNGVIFTIGEELLPILEPLLKDLAEWIADNRELISIVVKLGLALIAVTGVMFGAIAATALWNLKLLILNTTVGALLTKILLIPAAILAIAAAIALIVEDLNLFFAGAGVRTVTGDFVNSLGGFWEIIKEQFGGLIDWIWGKIKDLVAYLLTIPGKVFDAAKSALQRYVEAFTQIIEGVVKQIEDAVSRLPFIDYAAGFAGGVFGGGPSAASGLAAGGAASGGIGSLSVTINAAPGQTPEAIAGETLRVLGAGGAAVGLVGLGK